MFDVGRVVERTHVGGGHASGETFERGADLRVFEQCRGAGDRRGVVGREIMLRVLELHEIERANQPGGRIAGDEIHLT